MVTKIKGEYLRKESNSKHRCTKRKLTHCPTGLHTYIKIRKSVKKHRPGYGATNPDPDRDGGPRGGGRDRRHPPSPEGAQTEMSPKAAAAQKEKEIRDADARYLKETEQIAADARLLKEKEQRAAEESPNSK